MTAIGSQFRSWRLAGAALLAAQNEPAPVREGGYWIRTVQGAIERFRHGTFAGGDHRQRPSARHRRMQQANYTLKLRVKAGDAREAEALFDRFNVKTRTEGGWAYLKVTPPQQVSGGLELTVTGPRTLRDVWVETHGGNVQRIRLRTADWKLDRRRARSRWVAFGATANCGQRAATFKSAA